MPVGLHIRRGQEEGFGPGLGLGMWRTSLATSPEDPEAWVKISFHGRLHIGRRSKE